MNITKILLMFVILISASTYVSAKSLIIENNERLNFEDIDNLTPFDLKSSNLNDEDLNQIIKDIVSSDLISNLDIKIDNKYYYLIIDESIFVNQIFINGNIKLKNTDILQNILIKDKSYINKNNIQFDIQTINNLYSTIGQQDVLVSSYLEKFNDNSYNLIFNVSENFEKYVNRIFINGNIFTSNKFIKSLIPIKEKKFFTLLSNSNFIDENKIYNSVLKISNIYKDSGFLDVSVNYEIKEFKNKISLYLYIDEGARYLIDNINFISKNDEINTLFKKYNNEVELLLKNNFYNSDVLYSVSAKFNEQLLLNNFPNLEIDYSYTLTNVNNINIDFFLIESSPTTINKINFFGNNVTKDITLRRQIYVKPGDLYNSRLNKKSLNNLIRRPYIDNATINSSLNDDNSTDLNFTLTEKIKSGNFKLGAGYSAQGGISTAIGLSDSNFYGTGNKLNADIALSDKSVLFDLSYNKFYFYDYPIDNFYRFYNESENLKTTYGYKRDSNGLEFGVKIPYKYDISKDEYYRFSIGYEDTNVYELTSTASNSVTQNSGKSKNFVINSFYVKDNTNDNFNPTSGNFHKITVNLSPSKISDDDYIKISTNNNYYFTLDNKSNSVFILSKLGIASGLSKKIKTNDSFSLGGDFKGYQYSGIGPRDTSLNYLGGTKMYQLTVGYATPTLFDNTDTLIIKYFATIGSIFDSEYTSAYNSKTPRASIGVSMDIMTAVGPLSFSLAKPISKQTGDKTQTFDFSFGSAF